MSITIEFKDGSKRDFPHKGRPGGSYTKKCTYEGAFVVVEDEYGVREAFPAADVKRVVENPIARSW